MSEIIEDDKGKWEVSTNEFGITTRALIEPSQHYLDNDLYHIQQSNANERKYRRIATLTGLMGKKKTLRHIEKKVPPKYKNIVRNQIDELDDKIQRIIDEM
jgi:hypothetical protein